MGAIPGLPHSAALMGAGFAFVAHREQEDSNADQDAL
jgi:hypothetical protein